MNTTGKNRAAGTVGFERSVHYVRDQLEATKFFDVTVQPFEAGSYSVGVSKLSVLSPVPVNLVQGSSAQFQVITNSKVGSVNGTLSLAKNNGLSTQGCFSALRSLSWWSPRITRATNSASMASLACTSNVLTDS